MFYNVIMLMVLVQNSGYLNEIGCVSIKNLNKFLAMTCYPCGRPRLNDFGSTTKPTFWFNASVVTPQIFSKCQNLQSLVKNFIPACRADNIDSCRFTEKECWYKHKPEENTINYQYDEMGYPYIPNTINTRILDMMEKFTERLQILEEQI